MISLTLYALTAVFNAATDSLKDFYRTSRFSHWFGIDSKFWNPEISWMNKWKSGKRENGERFFGSSTIFVAFIDGWHLIKLLMLLSFVGTVVSYTPILNWYMDIVIYAIIWFVFFELSYRYFKKEI